VDIVPALMQALQDTDEDNYVRRFAANALNEKGEDESIICRGLPAFPGIVSGQVFLKISHLN